MDYLLSTLLNQFKLIKKVLDENPILINAIQLIQIFPLRNFQDFIPKVKINR